MATTTTANSRRFRIAFSFAGEKRAFVAQVAAILANRFGEEAILYDKYHEAEFARRDLGLVLPDLYHNESDLTIVILSKDYERKEWCGLEWVAIHARLKNRHDPAIMLTRFEFAAVQGLYDTAGFVELDNYTPDQAATLILQRLAVNEGKPKNHYLQPQTEPAKTTTPNNLPRLGPFFGRDDELKRIADALAPTSRGWGALIDGPGGIGKTSLAIRAAELVPAGRFRRIVFLSAKVRDLTTDGERKRSDFVVPSYLDMLNALARELGQSEISKSPESDRTHFVLNALRDGNVLLVLDNLESLPADDRDRLFVFLNELPAGCSAIVTSRRRADAPAVLIRLDRLDWPAAEALIEELAENNEPLKRATVAERRSLYEETGGNPLLLNWLTGQMRIGRKHTIAETLAALHSAPSGNDPLEYVFGDLLDTVAPNETKVLAALSHFTAPVETKFIAELAGINPAAAEGALGDLAVRALVQPDLEDRRFALVALVADFLRRRRPQAIAETGNRLANRAYVLIVENGYEQHARFPILDAAWPTLAPALPLLIAGPNDRLQTVCDALTSFLNFTGRWDERVSLNEQAEAKAVSSGDLRNAGWRAYQAGWVAFLRGQADEVLAGAFRAESHWVAANAGARERATAVRLRGMGHDLKKDYPAALAAYREALELYRGLSAQSPDVAIVLNDIAAIERKMGDYATAERDYIEALRISRAVANSEGVAASTGNLAELKLGQQKWSEAETLAREALPLSEGIGRIEMVAEDCRRIAMALNRQGKSPDEALRFAQRAVDLFTQLGSRSLEEARTTLRECEAALTPSTPPES